MEVWNDEAPNAHTTMDEEYFNTPTEDERPAPPEELQAELQADDVVQPVVPELVPDEFGDVYAADGTYIGNVLVNQNLTEPTTATGNAASVHVDQTTGDIVDENGNVIGSAYDNGSVVTMGGNQNQPSGPDLIVDEMGDIYDKDGNYLGNAADMFIDEYGNVFDSKGNFVGTTVPQNASVNSASSNAQTPNTPGAITPKGGGGGAGGGASGSGGSGSGASVTPPATKPSPASSTPGTTAQKILVQQIKSGTSLIKIYSDGSRETIANYFAPAITSGIAQTNPAAVTTRTTPTLNNRVNGLTGSITGTPTSQNDFLAAVFGNINKGLTGPGSGNVSMTGFNPGTQLTSSGGPRVAAGRPGGSTAPTSTVNTLVAGSKPGQQGNSNLTPPSAVMGGQVSSGAGGIAALAIGAVALFALAS